MQRLPLDFELDPRDFTHVLDVVELDDQPQLRYMHNLRPATHFWRLPPDLPVLYTRFALS